MGSLIHPRAITVSQYLEAERTAQRKHEYVDGLVYAVPDATADHRRIAANTAEDLEFQLRGRRYQVFGREMKIRIQQSFKTRFYYPDLSVVREPNVDHNSFQDQPAVIVEVMSKATRRISEQEKRDAYLSINSLTAYIQLDLNEAAAVVYRRTEEGFTMESYDGYPTLVPLAEIDCELSLAKAYAHTEVDRSNKR